MGFIKFDGSNGEEIRAALNELKPKTVLRSDLQADGTLRIDMVWPDGQVSEGRWFVREGDTLDTETGATVAPYGNLVDDAITFRIGLPG